MAKLKVKDLLGKLKLSDTDKKEMAKRIKEYREKVSKDILERREQARKQLLNKS